MVRSQRDRNKEGREMEGHKGGYKEMRGEEPGHSRKHKRKIK